MLRAAGLGRPAAAEGAAGLDCRGRPLRAARHRGGLAAGSTTTVVEGSPPDSAPPVEGSPPVKGTPRPQAPASILSEREMELDRGEGGERRPIHRTPDC